MAKVKLNFRRLSVPEKIAKARQIITALTGNASFPNPNPPLETITAGINALDGAYATTQSRKQAVKTAVADQTTKEDALDQLISKCGSYVESVAGNGRFLDNTNPLPACGGTVAGCFSTGLGTPNAGQEFSKTSASLIPRARSPARRVSAARTC